MELSSAKGILDEISQSVFDVELEEHQRRTGRRVYGFEMIQDADGKTEACAPLFGDPPANLLDAIASRGLPCGIAAVAVNADIAFEPRPDLFFVAARLIGEPPNEIYALLFHELCHFFVESGLADRFGSGLAEARVAGQAVRRYTRYADHDPDADRRMHTDDWFAVLFHMAACLPRCFPKFFSSHKQAVELALVRERFDEPMIDVPWTPFVEGSLWS